MALRSWDPNARPPLRVGYALFDTALRRFQPATYHAMLIASEAIEATTGTTVRVAEMGPPLRFGDEPEAIKPLHDRSYVGWMDELTDENYQRALAAANSLRGRLPSSEGTPGSYWLGTHGVEVSDPNDEDGAFATPHCSCASLLEWCYQAIDVDLVRAATLPQYSAEEIQRVFCRFLPIEKLRVRLETWGLSGDAEPWPLLLPAQQMMALREGCPRDASKGDHPWQDE